MESNPDRRAAGKNNRLRGRLQRMSQADQQWEILGYDTRRIGKSIAGAWRDLLWGDESPLKIHLDEAVRLQGEGSERFVQSGSDITPTTRACEGILLPDELVLGKSLQVPRAVEVDLPSVMDLEVSANSPFPIGYTLGILLDST